MQEFIEKIIMFGLIGVIVRFLILKQMDLIDKYMVAFKKNNKAVVRLPSFYKWIGLLFTILIVIVTFGDTIFPEIFVKTPIIEILPLSFPLFLLGMYLTMVGLFWNIQVDENSDYFIYRTIFGRSYKIFYNEISYYKTWKHAMIMKYKKKFFIIDTYSINYHFFLQMLIRKDVKKIFKRT